MALLFSGVMMLQHMNYHDMADRIMKALAEVLSEGKVRTRDLGGKSSTIEFTEAICRKLA
jgi:isocitrate dehydrogenase (NAD+)